MGGGRWRRGRLGCSMASILSRASVGWVLGWTVGGVTRRLGVKGTFHIYKFSRSHVGCSVELWKVRGLYVTSQYGQGRRAPFPTMGSYCASRVQLNVPSLPLPPLSSCAHNSSCSPSGFTVACSLAGTITPSLSTPQYTRLPSPPIATLSQRHTPLFARLKAHHGLL